MSAWQIEMLLRPVTWAHQTLDRARSGEDINGAIIDVALRLTGDIR